MRVDLDRETLPGESLEQEQPVCGYGPDDYAQVLTDLLPWGWAWPRDPASVLMRVFAGLAAEFSRIHGRDCDLLRESYPCGANEALSDWERIAGLPDPCLPHPPNSLQARRMAVCFKLGMRGGASKDYFIWLARLLGYEITITEFEPFRTGRNRVGDRLYGEAWSYAWRINAAETKIYYFRTGQSTAGERLRYWVERVLECVLNRFKPAHTILQFAYGGAAPQPTVQTEWDESRSIWDDGTALWDVA